MPAYDHVDSQCPLPVSTKEGASMTMPRRIQIRRRVNRVRQAAFCSGRYKPQVFATTLHNEKLAVAARVIKPTQAVDQTEMSHYCDWVKSNLSVLIPGWRKCRPVPFAEYVRRSNASVSVKTTLIRTKLALDAAGIGTDMVPQGVAHKWTTRKSFVKVENNLYLSPAERLTGKPKAPRLIQGASPEFICLMGPITMAVQDMIKKSWNKTNWAYFTSGATNAEVGKYVADGGGLIQEDDVSSYDSSICSAICELEAWLMEKLGATPLQLQLFRANISTHGWTSRGIRYKVDGTRKSGDPWTSVFNSLLNGCMHLWAYVRLSGIGVRTAVKHYRIVVQGDDSLARHPGVKLDFKSMLAKLGFECICIYRSSLYDAEFCNSLVYQTVKGPIMGPKVGRVLAKLGYFNNPPLRAAPKSILRGIALGFQQVAKFVPLLMPLVDRLLRITQGHKAVFTADNEWQMKMCGAEGLEIENLFLMKRRYDLSHRQLADMASSISTWELGQDISGGFFPLVLDRDTDARKAIFVSEN